MTIDLNFQQYELKICCVFVAFGLFEMHGTDEVAPSEMLLAVTSLWGKDLVEQVDRPGENKWREHRMVDDFSALDSMRAFYGAFRDSDHLDEQTKREVEYILSRLEQKDNP